MERALLQHETALREQIGKVDTKLTEARRPRTSATHGIAAASAIATAALLLGVMMRAPMPSTPEALSNLRLHNGIALVVLTTALWCNFSVLFDWAFCYYRAYALEKMQERLQRQVVQLSMLMAHPTSQTQVALDLSVGDLREIEKGLRILDGWRNPFGGF
jgi:hypothetical protein